MAEIRYIGEFHKGARDMTANRSSPASFTASRERLFKVSKMRGGTPTESVKPPTPMRNRQPSRLNVVFSPSPTAPTRHRGVLSGSHSNQSPARVRRALSFSPSCTTSPSPSRKRKRSQLRNATPQNLLFSKHYF